jgi:hypothetical protein
MASHFKSSFEPADLDHVISARAALSALLALLAAGALVALRLAAA